MIKLIGGIAVACMILVIITYIAATIYILRRSKRPNPKDEPVDALWWQMGDEIYTDPCETCHRWSECHGVDQENCPLWKKGEKHERKI